MTTKKQRKSVQEIPQASVLKPTQHKGIEGVCLACEKPIRTHYGHRGVWRGCQAEGLSLDTPFLLVPARRRADIKQVAAVLKGERRVDVKAKAAKEAAIVGTGRVVFEGVEDGSGVAVSASKAPSTREPRPYKVVYVADRRVKAGKFASERLQQVFKTVARRKHGLQRQDIMKQLKATKRPGVVDGALRRLVQAGAIHPKPLPVELTA